MTLNELAKQCYLTSKDKGFWDEGLKRNPAEMVALMHSECSELLEVIRTDKNWRNIPCEKPIPITAAEEELADILIRVLDFAHGHGLDIERAAMQKMAYNAQRPKKHGKEF